MVTGKKRITYGKVFLYLFTSLIAACCFLPILLIVIVSFTSEQAIVHNGYSFFPSELSLVAYNTLFENGAEVVRCYINSVFVTILGTILAVCITAMASYALVTPTVKYSNAIAMFFFVTMVFNGGMVPWYIICQNIGMSENYLALLIPNLIFSPFNLFLTRNYMREIPVSLMESAKLDGANDGQVAFRIYFPLCKPILATVGLFYGIAYWNDWWNTIMLVTNKNMYTIQYYLMKLKSDLNFMRTLQGGGIGGGYPPSESLQMATAVITIGPLILLYPFLQKYIVKGLVIGSVKG